MIVAYYDQMKLPESIRDGDEQIDSRRAREMLETLRNRALLYCLSESGGRISEVLSLRVGDFPAQCFESDEVWRVRVTGKRNHKYYLRFKRSLSRIQGYINARNAVRCVNRLLVLAGSAPLFVHHSKRYEGSPMSRNTAWKVVKTAEDVLGLTGISPHTYRHGAATRLVNKGHALDVVQEYLGHRTVETTRAHYARTKETRVDEAVDDVMDAG